MAAPCQALPTLLTSRPRPRGGAASLAKGASPAQPPAKLPEKYAMPVRVRNTFIDTSAERSPSLERFYQEREVVTCPSAHIGRLRNLFQEATEGNDPSCAAGGAGQACHGGGQGKAPREFPTYHSPEVSTSSVAGVSSGRPVAVLSLDQALNSSPQLHGGHASGGQMVVGVVGGSYAGNTGYTCMAPRGGLSLLQCGLEEAPLPPPPNRPALGNAEMPSVGSAGHAQGSCKPCAFFHTVGCTSGLACQFCHLCEAGERKRRRKEKLDARRASHKQRQASQQMAAASRDGN
uniref:C3H1-type domain-containing protein n=1 Tax=Alexandrium monilatum TaxID=311494 RepID=A0A7S4R696_9DINO